MLRSGTIRVSRLLDKLLLLYSGCRAGHKSEYTLDTFEIMIVSVVWIFVEYFQFFFTFFNWKRDEAEMTDFSI